MAMRFIGYVFGIGAACFVIAAVAFAYIIHIYSKDLPDYTVLRDYEPEVMTRIHAANGQLIAEYAHERRIFLPIQAMPDLLKNAFLSAEDKNFYEHSGIDYIGVGRAILTNVRNYGTGRRPVGASTITQQVAKNFLLTNEAALERKIREAILSIRIERTFSKDKILELYLNEIYLGIGAYGVPAASLLYFDKSVHQLSLAEAAYLAALPKAPNNYHPFRHRERGINRRNWVIDRMVENGYISFEKGEKAKAEDLIVTPRERGNFIVASDYFAEQVRREIVGKYSENRLYEGGLSVRTTLDIELQKMAHKSLREGLVAYDRKQGWGGPVASIKLEDDWGVETGKLKGLFDVPEWRLAVVLEVSKTQAKIGLQPPYTVSGALSEKRQTGVIPLKEMQWAKWGRGRRKGRKVRRPSDILTPGDVIYVEKIKGHAEESNPIYSLQQIPRVSGAMVVMDPVTGRVLALVGGFSFASSEFNRATQAHRQPGSSFKPFVYAAALDNGYTPSSVIMDAAICLEQGPGLPEWCPQNYSKKFYGPSTLRRGIEQSRNVMTVRLAKDMGMPIVSEYARRFGIYDNLSPVLAMSLGAGETTVLRLTTAYATIANGGRKITASLIDRIQDRYGHTIFKHDKRVCQECASKTWQKQKEPALIDEREQVLDPMTAYQITSMMEGVVKHGTGARAFKEFGRPVAGKTGTTNDYRDAWFVGFTPDLVVGVFVGYDTPKSMGRSATGGGLAAPIFRDFMEKATKGKPPLEFQVPKGLKLIPIDRRTGMQVAHGGKGVILEAFKPGIGPPNSYSIIGGSQGIGEQNSLPDNSSSGDAVVTGTGGLY